MSVMSERETVPKVLVVFPTAWDERQLRACRSRWADRFEVELLPPFDHDWRWDLDVVAHLERAAASKKGEIDGVFSSSDYPGATVAGAIATRLGLPGTPPDRVIRASHKYYSRLVQRDATPDATPWFELVDPRAPEPAKGLRFPCFVKPVKGAFSVMASRIDSKRELERFLSKPATAEFLTSYVFVFNRLVRELTDLEIDGSYFIAEGLLKGRQVTVEGLAGRGGRVDVLGIVDSVRHPSTKSFVRFDYPSSLPRRVRDRMNGIAIDVVRALGLESTLFNIEMTYDVRRDRIFIVEVNPRMCGQFADLYEKVDGVNGYELALDLAVGQQPAVERGRGRHRVASSFPLRIFEPVRVVKAPTENDIRTAERLHDGTTLVWPECSEGDALADFESLEDGKSFRYAVVNVGAPDRGSLQRRLEEVRRVLDYRFEPLP
jgi:biotin carboxylase